MKCPMCKGGRKVLKKEKGDMGYIVRLAICDKCNGTGEVEMTNEEYIKSCSTDELAELIADICYGLLGDVAGNCGDVADGYYWQEYKSKWVEWLKEKYE